MADKTRIETDSNARVALDLAENIYRAEPSSTKIDRAYWLKLYVECRRAVTFGKLPSDQD